MGSDAPRGGPSGAALARAHGLLNLAGGAWPLISLPSFEAVFGPKTDRWLVRTVSGLLVVNGLTQLAAATSPAGVPYARRLGLGTAGVLAAVDLGYATRGRISRMYLLDAAVELAWVVAWTMTRPSPGARL
jgi:hypothetical protein